MPLYIVSTPIGNLKDISFRAVEVLKSVDYILCEDTRVTGKLLNHLEISKKMISFNDFNEVKKIPEVIDDISSGKNVALVSDAGTPLISDPGFKLAREAVAKNIRVESIPGASAALASLVVSGLPIDKFLFIGFLPKKDGKRKTSLEQVKKSKEVIKTTVIIYEAPYRLVKTLESIKGIFGDIDVVVCREITKLHEQIVRQNVSTVIEHFTKITPRGEFVILF